MPSKRKATDDLDFVLRRVFNKPTFRPYQREIILATLEGHDVFVQAATSFGKSLCYQLPAIIDHGITICISPLLALMKNQVQQLENAGVLAASLNSNTSPQSRDEIFDDLRCGHPKTRLLYVTPEYTLSETFRKHLRTIYQQKELARVAIDEAHCISEWGHEFRPSFLHLRYFREAFPQTPIIALTATATQNVRDDILEVLSLKPSSTRIFTTTTSRPNLHYEVRFISSENDDRFESFLSWLKKVHSRRSTDPQRKKELEDRSERFDAVSGIIYTTFRSDCDELAQRLKDQGIGAAPYHAGLETQERIKTQTKWLASEPGYDVIVATTAFGMGIDKENVRFVVHWTLPKTFEGFYQESGRAGRDGKASLCILYYSREDRDRTAYRIGKDPEKKGPGGEKPHMKQIQVKMESFRSLIKYCEDVNHCRHKLITTYFGEPPEAGRCDRCCDFCKDPAGLKRRKRKGLTAEEFVSSQQLD